jgi:hypothetical protein
MSMDFCTWSGLAGDAVVAEVNVGGSTGFRLMTCLGFTSPEPDGEMELDDFSNRLDGTLSNWGPYLPGYPDAQYERDYGRGPDYVLYWLEELVAMCAKARERGHSFIVWM